MNELNLPYLSPVYQNLAAPRVIDETGYRPLCHIEASEADAIREALDASINHPHSTMRLLKRLDPALLPDDYRTDVDIRSFVGVEFGEGEPLSEEEVTEALTALDSMLVSDVWGVDRLLESTGRRPHNVPVGVVEAAVAHRAIEAGELSWIDIEVDEVAYLISRGVLSEALRGSYRQNGTAETIRASSKPARDTPPFRVGREARIEAQRRSR